MDPKLIMLYLLIGTIIGLSQHDDERNMAKMKRELNRPCWCIPALALWWRSTATKP